MNMLNTTAEKRETALAEAIFILQTLSDSLSLSILDYFQENHEATLLDLIIATGTDSTTLDAQLDLLRQTKVVQSYNTLYSSWYQVDYQRLDQVNRIARQLAKRK